MENKNLDGGGKSHRMEQKRLASVIKGVHKHLRRKFRESNGDHQGVWDNHAQDDIMLKSYADAMKRLAFDHWSEFPESRVDWCYKFILEYFLSGGLHHALKKDAKHAYFERLRKIERENCDIKVKELHQSPTTAPHPHTTESCQMTSTNASGLARSNQLSMIESINVSPPLPPPPSPIRVLDVGSCFNPFKGYHHLDTIAIDLCPADESVFQCDFLQLDLIKSDHVHRTDLQDQTDDIDSSPSSFLQHLRSPIRQLPECSFHVVVCCLLLEYLPCRIQRTRCCIKACGLLRMNGLLFLVTPDSKSAHHNVPMMKSWKSALEQMGMVRWKYTKMQHLHCMAFRKISETPLDELCTLEKDLAPLIYIPQDFNDACYDDVIRKSDAEKRHCLQVSEENESFRSQVIGELPLFSSDSEDDDVH